MMNQMRVPVSHLFCLCILAMFVEGCAARRQPDVGLPTPPPDGETRTEIYVTPSMPKEKLGEGLFPAMRQWVDMDLDGITPRKGDLNDADETSYPGAHDLCDGVDNDYDARVDEDAASWVRFYKDVDGDGYGLTGSSLLLCRQPKEAGYTDAVYVGYGGDCDDGTARVNPGVMETLGDGIDNNCDGIVEETVAEVVEPPVVEVAPLAEEPEAPVVERATPQTEAPPPRVLPDKEPPATRVAPRTATPNTDVLTTSPEFCDGVDNDRDGAIDEGVLLPLHRDLDEDGFGNAAETVASCQRAGFVTNNRDCNDRESRINPRQSEICEDEVDNNCDGQVNEDCGLAAVSTATKVIGGFLALIIIGCVLLIRWVARRGLRPPMQGGASFI